MTAPGAEGSRHSTVPAHARRSPYRSLLSSDMSEMGTLLRPWVSHQTTRLQSRPRAAAVSRVIAWYALSRVLMLMTLALAAELTGRGFTSVLEAWDGPSYLQIAAHGYVLHQHLIPSAPGLAVNRWDIAYFPGYPLGVALLHLIGLPVTFAAALLSCAGGLIAAVMVYELGRICFESTTGERAAQLFCLFPGALVFSWTYSEGLGLALGLSALVLLLKRRWLLAGLLAACAGAVHSDVAVALSAASVAAAGVAIMRQRDWRSLAAPVIAPLGALAYLAYLQVATGSWRNWLATEQYGWMQHTDFGLHTLVMTVSYLEHPGSKAALVWLLSGACALALLGCLWLQRCPLPVTVMALAALAVAATSTDVGLRPRALLIAGAAVPAAAAALGERGTRIISLLWAGLAPLLMLAYLTKPVLIP